MGCVELFDRPDYTQRLLRHLTVASSMRPTPAPVRLFSVGWATGKFGLFGLSPDKVSSPGLNYAGVALSTCAICVFLFIKPSVEGPKGAKTLDGEDDEETAADGLLDGEEEDGKLASGSEGGSFIDRMAPGPKRMLGIFGSCVAGILYGANFDPPR